MLGYISQYEKEHFSPRKELVDVPPTQNVLTFPYAITMLMICLFCHKEPVPDRIFIHPTFFKLSWEQKWRHDSSFRGMCPGDTGGKVGR